MLYAEAKALLETGRGGRKVLVRKLRTVLELGSNDTVVMRLVDTPIIGWRPNGDIQINTNLWRTRTTKRRFNDYLPSEWYVYSRQGIWYIRHGDWDNGTTYVFADNMTLHPDGTVRGAATLEETEKLKALPRQINVYAKGFVDALAAGEIAEPSAGDCWHCSMKSQTGKTLGDEVGTGDHLRSHIEEGYYVPSLLANAIAAYPVSIWATSVIGVLWSGGPNRIDELAKKQVYRSIRLYLRRKLGLS